MAASFLWQQQWSICKVQTFGSVASACEKLICKKNHSVCQFSTMVAVQYCGGQHQYMWRDGISTAEAVQYGRQIVEAVQYHK